MYVVLLDYFPQGGKKPDKTAKLILSKELSVGKILYLFCI